MSSLPAGSLLGISLLHVTQAQSANLSQLASRTDHGLKIAAGWQRRLPVIIDLMPADSSVSVPQVGDSDHDHLLLSGWGTADVQKLLKAFGNRLAGRARKPLRFERVIRGGSVHLAPANHHLAACGALVDGAATDTAATCPGCILLALTLPPMDRSFDFHPGGRVYVDDAELRSLRDHVCRGVHPALSSSAAKTR